MHGPSLLELISKHKQKAHPLALRALRMMSTFDDITMVLYRQSRQMGYLFAS